VDIRRFLRSPVAVVLALLADFLLWGGPHRPDLAFRNDLNAAFAAQAQATRDWIDLPGVVGTAVGLNASGDPVVKVYLSQVGVAALPAMVAGVGVQVEVTGPITAIEWGEPESASRDGAAAVNPKGSFPRPVPIGVSTGHPGVTAGTIGARVTDGPNVFALSNNHVFANGNNARPGDPTLQPGIVDGGRDPDDAVGTLHDFEPIRYCGQLLCPENRIDGAIALTTTDDQGRDTPEGGYGTPRSSTTEASLGMAVQKYGRTTGHTHGTITGINAVLDIAYRGGEARFVDQIIIADGTFSTGGDSGSLVVTEGILLGDRRPVGLLFAGSDTYTVANPIDLVLDRFGVTIDGSGL
jgi:hypothetical protein